MAQPSDRVPDEATRLRRLQAVLVDFVDFVGSGEVITLTIDGSLTVNLGASGRLVNSGGALIVNEAVASWRKITVGFAALTAAALTNDIELLSLPAGGFIEMVKIKHSTAFAGGGITALDLSVGIASDLTKYAADFDVFQAVGGAIFVVDFLPDSEDHGSVASIRVAATAVGGNLDALSGGSVDIWVKYGLAV